MGNAKQKFLRKNVDTLLDCKQSSTIPIEIDEYGEKENRKLENNAKFDVFKITLTQDNTHPHSFNHIVIGRTVQAKQGSSFHQYETKRHTCAQDGAHIVCQM